MVTIAHLARHEDGDSRSLVNFQPPLCSSFNYCWCRLLLGCSSVSLDQPVTQLTQLWHWKPVQLGNPPREAQRFCPAAPSETH